MVLGLLPCSHRATSSASVVSGGIGVGAIVQTGVAAAAVDSSAPPAARATIVVLQGSAVRGWRGHCTRVSMINALSGKCQVAVMGAIGRRVTCPFGRTSSQPALNAKPILRSWQASLYSRLIG